MAPPVNQLGRPPDVTALIISRVMDAGNVQWTTTEIIAVKISTVSITTIPIRCQDLKNPLHYVTGEFCFHSSFFIEVTNC